MVCPNCQSTDIVTIQGQSYCINCGQLVPEDAKTTKAEPAQVKEKVATAAVKKAEKPVTPSVKPSPAPKAAIINHAKPAASVSAPVPAAVTAPRAGRKVSDLSVAKKPKTVKPEIVAKPAEPEAVAVPTPEPEPIIVPRKTAREKRREAKAAKRSDEQQKTDKQKTSKTSLFGEAFKTLIDRRFWSFGLTAAILAALPVSAVSFFIMNQIVQLWSRAAGEPVGEVFRTLNSVDLAVPLELGQDLSLISALLLAYLALAHCIQSYAGNAIIFGASKVADKRNSAASSWANAGLNSLWGVVFLDVLTAILVITIITVNGLVAQYGLLAQLDPAMAGYARAALWLLSALLVICFAVTRKLSRAALVLGNLTPTSAYATGWKLLWKNLATIVATILVTSVFNILLVSGYIFAIAVLLMNFRPELHSAYGLAATGLYALVGIFALAKAVIFNQVYWTGVYRRLVRKSYPNVAALLVARQPQSPTGLGIWVLGLMTVLLLAFGLMVALQS